MNLRHEVEKLLFWYVPLALIVMVSTPLLTTFIKSVNGLPVWQTSLLVYLGMFLGHLHYFVAAIWLYCTAKKTNQNYILWAFFGLTSHILAVVVFLVLYLLDEKLKKSD